MTSVSLPASTAPAPDSGEPTKRKSPIKWLIFAAFAGLFLALLGLLGAEGEQNFDPAAEFTLDTWIPIELGSVDLSINKAIVYILAAAILTAATMLFVSKRMQARPNRLQTAIETAWQFTANNIIGDNMEREQARKFFPFLLTLFLFIWWSNMIGYIPLPTSTLHPVEVFGVEVPTLALYAATANLGFPLVLALFVWVIYHVEGIKEHGFIGYFKSWMPPGTPGWLKIPMAFIEVLGQIVRPVSLSVRLFANVLVGHLLLIFMGGGLAVILGISALGVFTLPLAVAFFLFEVGLIATLQAFIFASLAANYIGGAVSHDH